MCFKSDSLVSVVCHDVLKHFFLCQDVSILAVTLKPESRCLMVKVISYAEIIHSYSFNVFICINLHIVTEIIFRHVCALSKYIVWNWLFCFFLFFLHLGHHLIHVSYFLFLLFCFWFTSNVWYHLGIHINNLFLLSRFRIDCLSPSISKIDLFNALSSVFDILNSSGAWNFFGD